MLIKWLLLLCLTAALPVSSFAEESISIGGEKIIIPLPQGFVRYDGMNPELDKFAESMIPASNRLVLKAAPTEDAAKIKAGETHSLKRFLNIQLLRKAETMTVNQKQFDEVASQVKKEMGAANGQVDVTAEVNKQLKNTKLPENLKMGETKKLGVFEETPQSVDVGMLMSMQVAGQPSETTAGVFSIVNVKGKMMYLYVYADYHSNEDVEWAKRTLKGWRESIVAANPGAIPKGGFSFDWDSMRSKGLIGAAIGGAAALLAMIFKKRQLPKPPA